MNPARLIILAKEPIPGLAKTRLIPALGPEKAARLADRLLRRSLGQAIQAGIGPVELCVTPAPGSAYWQTLPGIEAVHLTGQEEGDLGARMAAAATRGLSGGTPVILMGTDCPALDAGYLQAMAKALSHYDSCLCPVADGGYSLLGLSRFHDSLFTGIPWSTSEVAALTRQRLTALGWSCHEVKELNDVDEPEDLEYLKQACPDLLVGL